MPIAFAYSVSYRRHQHNSRQKRSCSSIPRRIAPRCDSLEDSKKIARSPYDNIPDLNELYLRELRRVRREQGYPDEDYEVHGSILRTERSQAVASPGGSSASMNDESVRIAREQSLQAYRRLRTKLFGDTAFLGALQCCGAWAFGSMSTVASVALGAAASLGYVALLSRGVDRMTKSGDPLALARVALLVLVVVGAARHRESFQVIPVVFGFFSYKIATLVPLLTGEAFEESL